MKKVFWSAFLIIAKINFGILSACDNSQDIFESQKSSSFQESRIVVSKSMEEKHMLWNKHTKYTMGAFGGAIVGSFFVNVFDTLAARKFALMQESSWRTTTKSIFASYIPVLVGVVPMRALSFGVYSVCQDLFAEHLSFGLNKTLSAAL